MVESSGSHHRRDSLKPGPDVGVAPSEVAVISPYDDQVDRIDDALGHEALEIDTVDGFQGREQKIVLVSLGRSAFSGRHAGATWP